MPHNMKQNLDQIIMDYYRSCVPSKQQRQRIKKLESFVKESVTELLSYQEYAVPSNYINDIHGSITFGSYPCGISCKHSDIDIAINIPDLSVWCKTASQRRHYITKVLIHLITILERKYSIHYESLVCLQIEKIFNANCPILRITERHSKITSDVSVANFYTKPTLKYMKTMMQWPDHRIKPMIMFIKMWTKQRGINNAYHRYLNSYGFTLLTIKYLQIVQPPILPICTYASVDLSELIIRTKIESTKNDMSLKELLCGFFDFYTNTFKAETCTVSLLGKRFEYKDPIDCTHFLCSKQQLYLIVEDPVQHTHNVAGNVRKSQWEHTINVFSRCHRVLTDFHLSSDISSEFPLLNMDNDHEKEKEFEEENSSDNSDYDVMNQGNEETQDIVQYLCGNCYIEKENGCADETDGVWYCLDCWRQYNMDRMDQEQQYPIDIKKEKEEKDEWNVFQMIHGILHQLHSIVSLGDIHRITSNCLQYLGEYEEAQRYFKLAMENRDACICLFEYGCFMFEWKRFDEANKHFVQLLDDIIVRGAPNTSISISTVYLYYARTLESMNETHKADMYYRRALSSNKSNDGAIAEYYYALFLWSVGRYTEYECYLKKAIEIYPHFTDAIDSLKTYYEEKKADADEEESMTHARVAFDKMWWDIASLASNSNFNIYYDNLVRLKMNDIRCLLFGEIKSLKLKLKRDVGIYLVKDLNFVLSAIVKLKHKHKEFMEKLRTTDLIKYKALFAHHAVYTLESAICNVKCEEDLKNMIQEYNNDKNENVIQYQMNEIGELLKSLLCLLN